MPIIGMVKLHPSELSSTNQTSRMIDTEARSTAKRCLFERPDHDHLMQQVMRQLQEQQEEDCKRWNFDFRTGKPLSGRYQWMPVSRPTIGFISSTVKRPRIEEPCSSADTFTDMPKLISNKDSCIQTRITDYMRTKKTSTSSSSSKGTEGTDHVNSSLGEDVEDKSQ